MTQEHHKQYRYPDLGRLAAIGDGRSLALLAPDAGVEWFCPIRFDNPPLVWPLLDRDRGGRLRLSPRQLMSNSIRYKWDTAVVEYEWRTATGKAVARVCMEWCQLSDSQRMLWSVTGLDGNTEVCFEFAPQPAFGRQVGAFNTHQDGVVFQSDSAYVIVQAAAPLAQTEDGVFGTCRLAAGETKNFCLTVSRDAVETPEPIALESVARRIDDTAAAWQAWTQTLRWSGPYRTNVIRSAITLKLLIYEPTGAVVAAATSALPEDIGGVRNWDYRYTWFRDAGLVLNTLYSLNCKREAHRWADWMQQAIMRHGTPLKVFYTLDGNVPPDEQPLPNVEGYKQSAPVRSGNAAHGQFQLDIYGELLDCVFICDTMDDDVMRRHWEHLRKAADFIADHWHEPDQGIWEVRSQPRHFVHSKVAAWAGLKRALWLRDRHQLECDREKWQDQADALKREILRFGVDHDNHRFKRAYDDPQPDASLLLLARYGFVEGDDPLFQNTVDSVQQELGICATGKRLLLRYRGQDGLPGEEGAFTICSFWLVDALARGGRNQEAEALLSYLVSLQGHCGLYSEEIDPKSLKHLGNIPQAFSHVGLINAAWHLTAAAPSQGPEPPS